MFRTFKVHIPDGKHFFSGEAKSDPCRDHAFCCGYADAKEGMAFPNKVWFERRYPNPVSREAYEEGFNEFVNNHQPF